MSGGRGIILLLAAVLVCAQLSFARAGEFASEFEEYEFHSGASQSAEPEDEAAVTYRVRKGDSVCTIARAHGISSDRLMDENNLTSGAIRAGMVLRIPAAKQSRAKTRPQKKAKTKEVFAPVRTDEKFLWPVSGVRAVRSDAEKGVNPLGVLISGKAGAKVVSAAPGVVEKVGRMRGFGTFVVVRHSDRLITVYACLGEVSVRRGDAVKRGESVGKLPTDENSLRFMVSRSGKPEDPMRYLPKGM